MVTPTPSEPHAPVRGSLIGPWQVQECVDSGSFGIIFKVVRASDPNSGPYAMKMAAQPDDVRFEREAVRLSLVKHPGIPRYHDCGTWLAPSGRGHPYVVMQWVEGVPLYQWTRATGRFLTSRQALHQLAQVAHALEALHAYGLHRDVKGDNILVRTDGSAVLLDVGACWLPDGQPLTQGGLPPGTPQYRSPQAFEYRERSRLDPEAHYEASPADDLYALGVTAYRLVTGTYPPEPGGSGRFLPPSALATVAPELEALIPHMLSYEPEARGTSGELAQALERVAAVGGKKLDVSLLPSPAVLPTEKSWLPGPWAWWARKAALPAAAVVLLLLVAAVVVLHEPKHGADRVPLIVEAWKPPPAETPDAGVGDMAMTEVIDVPSAGVPYYFLGLPMPKQPFPGQRKPPCSPRSEKEVLGACWTVLELRPPCEKEDYEHEGKCLRASFDEPRHPTSEQP